MVRRWALGSGDQVHRSVVVLNRKAGNSLAEGLSLCALLQAARKPRAGQELSCSSDAWKCAMQVGDGEWWGNNLYSGDQVECSAVVLNRKTGTALAEGIKCLCKAEDKRELGQVRS
jgi:mRNA-degrading endonuclease toxin of MazEF toxin-antitoxin module